ncbi:MAG: valine--tRNA ligase [Acidobacteria bacterium]|nr:valine--tRNA ligase [Acidobacteriota bacterium]
MQIDKVYEPQRFEPHWSRWWIEAGIFRAAVDSPGPVFSIVIPPPNVTGHLHMGHMLEHAEIDAVSRWHRMRGYNTLWLPGTDHAGIATQMVVERSLAAEGLTRHDLGREKFVERVWRWKAESGDAIKRQMIQLGASCDWSRERFTFDPGLSRAVREVFVRLYEKGLLYRGQYMVNWCPRCNTALSDLEVAHEESEGSLWHIRYPVVGSDRHLVVATTRPETMLGDTAVAVNAADARYADLHGKTVRLPLMNREIPIVLDDLADPKFGTGVVKVTPAHDPNDFECGKRHSLPSIKVIAESGAMTAEAGAYAGLDRFAARARVVADLEKLGLLDKIEPYHLSVGQCDRCKTVVEPLASNQWFVRMKPLAAKAIEVVEQGRIEIIPENWSKIYFDWMYNIRDWCVSRQLWWGHRIPAWHCPDCSGITVSRRDPAACAQCGSTRIEQDPDVLDTWFSAGLWPFSTMGWPDVTEDLKKFYPTSLLLTGFDILFFWVARMIMMGLECMGEIPFRQVYIHGLIRDAERQKMSKTKGNVIDPLEVTTKHGTDAVRLALLLGAAPGTDIVLSEERIESARAFANKIWNAARFLFLNMERCQVEPWLPEDAGSYRPGPDAPLEDRWIFSRLNQCAGEANRALEKHRFHEAAQTLWRFFWHEFCDWYVELKKLRFRENSGLNQDWRNVLAAFERALRLLHPVMPFLTEELWQRLKTAAQPVSIAVASYPGYDAAAEDPEAERKIQLIQDLVTEARNQRADMKLDPKQQVEADLFNCELDEFSQEAVQKLSNIRICRAGGAGAGFVVKLRVPKEQAVAQRARLQKERDQLEKVISSSARQLSDDAFTSRAPAKVVEGIRQKMAGYQAQLAKIQTALEALG